MVKHTTYKNGDFGDGLLLIVYYCFAHVAFFLGNK